MATIKKDSSKQAKGRNLKTPRMNELAVRLIQADTSTIDFRNTYVEFINLLEKVKEKVFNGIRRNISGQQKPQDEDLNGCFYDVVINIVYNKKGEYDASKSDIGQYLYISVKNRYLSDFCKKIMPNSPEYGRYKSESPIISVEIENQESLFSSEKFANSFEEDELNFSNADVEENNELSELSLVDTDTEEVTGEDTEVVKGEDIEKPKPIWVLRGIMDRLKVEGSQLSDNFIFDFESAASANELTKVIRGDDKINKFGRMLFSSVFEGKEKTSHRSAFGRLVTQKMGVELFNRYQKDKIAFGKLISNLKEQSAAITPVFQNETTKASISQEKLSGWGNQLFSDDANVHKLVEMLEALPISSKQGFVKISVVLIDNRNNPLFSFAGEIEISETSLLPSLPELFSFDLNGCILYSSIEPFYAIPQKKKKTKGESDEIKNPYWEKLLSLNKIVVGPLNPLNEGMAVQELVKGGVMVDFVPDRVQKELLDFNNHIVKSCKPYNIFRLLSKI